MLWLFWEFRLYETDGDVKKHILTEEIPKSYNFKILSCKEYRGFEFLGISSRGNTIRVHLSPFWDLCQKINPIVVFSRENQLSLWAKWQ